MHYNNRNKKELCRNFQRGSCQYGEKCKFLHVTPEQSKPNTNPFGFGTQQQPSRQKFDNNNTNPFGFGTQQQHRKPNTSNPFGFGAQQQQQPQKPANPFGFGVQSNNSHSKAPNDFGSKPHQFKPFENKWSRFSPISNSGQPDHQPQAQAANHHDCNDPDTCKRLILEDFEHERPLWKLTCYSHWKNGPCDISGDVSYEELRAVAYDDARRGLSLPLIVERERNLLNSKLIEFENFLQNPYVAPSKSALHGAVRFPVGTSGAATAAGQSSASTPFSNLSQSNVQLNLGHSIPANSAFGQSTLLPNSVQTSNAFGSRLSPNVFGQPVSLSSSGQTANAFGTNKFLSGDAGFSSNGIIGDQGKSFSSSAIQMQNTPPLSIQHHLFTDGTNIDPNPVGQADRNSQLLHEQKRENISGDDSIWLKENWIPGEIPEEAPPDAFIR